MAPTMLRRAAATITLAAVAFTLMLTAPANADSAPRNPPWLLPVTVPTASFGPALHPGLVNLNRRAFAKAGILAHDFDLPAQNWLPGHRGVDLFSPDGIITAPAAGTITFAGKVAGKPVVSFTHANGLRSTYEPAQTDLPRGTALSPGEHLATISPVGPSHCPGSSPYPPPATQTVCLHWGVKDEDTYLDPWRLVQPHVRIILLR